LFFCNYTTKLGSAVHLALVEKVQKYLTNQVHTGKAFAKMVLTILTLMDQSKLKVWAYIRAYICLRILNTLQYTSTSVHVLLLWSCHTNILQNLIKQCVIIIFVKRTYIHTNGVLFIRKKNRRCSTPVATQLKRTHELF